MNHNLIDYIGKSTFFRTSAGEIYAFYHTQVCAYTKKYVHVSNEDEHRRAFNPLKPLFFPIGHTWRRIWAKIIIEPSLSLASVKNIRAWNHIRAHTFITGRIAFFYPVPRRGEGGQNRITLRDFCVGVKMNVSLKYIFYSSFFVAKVLSNCAIVKCVKILIMWIGSGSDMALVR